MIERLSFFGLGKLGLPLAGLFASSGLPTIAIDRDGALVGMLNAGSYPDSEPRLAEILAEARPNLRFTARPEDAADTDASIILVPTPSSSAEPAFSSDQVQGACEDLCRALANSTGRPRRHAVIISSTMSPGAIARSISPVFARHAARHREHRFELAYVPDFVALGEVIAGFVNPACLLVGSDDLATGERVAQLYRRIIAPQTPVRLMAIKEAEITKLAHNVFCCMKISFGNFLLQLGDRMGGLDVDEIVATLALDRKIGPGLLRGGAPYGGPCFPRDIDALLDLANSFGLDAPLARAPAEVNAAQYDLIETIVIESGARRAAVLGLSFKHGSPYTIGSPGIELARRLEKRSLGVVAFDPASRARAEARQLLGPDIRHAETLEDSWADVDALVLCTADPSFADLAARGSLPQ